MSIYFINNFSSLLSSAISESSLWNDAEFAGDNDTAISAINAIASIRDSVIALINSEDVCLEDVRLYFGHTREGYEGLNILGLV